MRDALASLPSVAVIVPTLNRPRELTACLDALASLDYPADRYEIVVVDDGSDPPVAPRADLGRPGLRVRWLAQPNAGPSAARNAGARVADGEILAFTDDDCTPAPGWLRAMATAVVQAPQALHGGRVENALDGNPCSVASQTITEVIVPHLIASGSALRFVTSNNLALTADGYRAMGGFDERFRTAEDREFCHRWVASGRPIAAVPDAVVLHRHDLTLASFWRQHFGYGRGACRFHAIRATGGRSLWADEIAMYAKTFRRPFAAMPLPAALRITALLVVWQVANASGFACQWVRDRRRGPG
jgi:glycosyltransferase involved in cell wall biosynthesis